MNPHEEWCLISDVPPPTDDTEFFIGMWDGEKLWNESYTNFCWIGKPVWKQALSHNENPLSFHETRGWNHRSGPLGGNATHWRHVFSPPKLTDLVALPADAWNSVIV